MYKSGPLHLDDDVIACPWFEGVPAHATESVRPCDENGNYLDFVLLRGEQVDIRTAAFASDSLCKRRILKKNDVVPLLPNS